MISRVASSCFWLNRYVERLEVLARLQDVNLAFQLDVNLPDVERWRPLVVVTGQAPHYLASKRPDELDDANPSSLAASLEAARENARTIRETISLEMWETVNDLWLWLAGRAARRLYDEDRHAFYQHVKNQCLLFHGIAEATMLHDEPFRFMRLGTTLERAGQTARILDVKHHSMGPGEAGLESPTEAAQWLATLRFCSAVEPFFKREVETFSGSAVAQFLLFDPALPRSVRCNLERSRNLLRLIRMADSPIGRRSAEKLDRMIEKLDGLAHDPNGIEGLHELFTWLVDTTADVCRLVHEEFFDPSQKPSATTSSSQSQA
jgi:uncharacterized alpha-E superfamily protein